MWYIILLIFVVGYVLTPFVFYSFLRAKKIFFFNKSSLSKALVLISRYFSLSHNQITAYFYFYRLLIVNYFTFYLFHLYFVLFLLIFLFSTKKKTLFHFTTFLFVLFAHTHEHTHTSPLAI